MARTSLTVTEISCSSPPDLTSLLTAVDAANGNNFAHSGTTFLAVKNASGSSITVTVATPYTQDSLSLADLTATVEDGETRLIGPFPRDSYEQSDGKVNVDWSSGTSVTVAVLKV